MITKTSLLRAATHHGIFITSTNSGQCGGVLLASLSPHLNFNLGDDGRALLELIAHGEISPITYTSTRDRTATEENLQTALIERGIPAGVARRLVQLSWLGDTDSSPNCWYYALVLPAHAASADTLRDYPIRRTLKWLGHRTDLTAIHLREACSIALGEVPLATPREQQTARAICARWWNHYAGITP